MGMCNYGPLGLAALSWMCQGFLFFKCFFPLSSIEHLQLSLTLFGTLDASNCIQGIQREAFQTNTDSWKTLACVQGGEDFFFSFLLFKMIKKHCGGLVCGREGKMNVIYWTPMNITAYIDLLVNYEGF